MRIDLQYQQLLDEDMENAAQEAVIKKRCTELDLGQKNIPSNSVSSFSHVLRENRTLKRLYLGNNQIADDGARQLALSIESSTLAVLGLSKNSIADLGAQHRGGMLEKNRHLTVIGLENNEIGDRRGERLANALKYNNDLIRLYLDGNN